jgi:hypothetical protein
LQIVDISICNLQFAICNISAAPPARKDNLAAALAADAVDPAHNLICGDEDDHQRLDDIDQVD